MKGKALDERIITQYLLGLLSEDERQKVEETYFQDDSAFDSMTALEDDLIDDYVRGRLNADFRNAFELRMKSEPYWQNRVVFAQALIGRIAADARVTPAAPSPSLLEKVLVFFRITRPTFQLAVVTSMLALGGVLWLTWEVRQERARVQSLTAQRDAMEATIEGLRGQLAAEQAQAQQLTGELNDERQRRQALETQGGRRSALGMVASLFLRAGTVRSTNDTPRLTVPPGAATVRLQLDVANAGDYERYRVAIQSTAGAAVRTIEDLRPQDTSAGRVVVVDLPPALLPSGEYEIALFGRVGAAAFEEVAFYYFRTQPR